MSPSSPHAADQQWSLRRFSRGGGQTMIHQWVETNNGDTFWVQRQTSTTPAMGSLVTINDTAPTNDRWDLAAVDVTST